MICSGAPCGFFRLRVPTRWCGACNFVVCALNSNVAFLWPTCGVRLARAVLERSAALDGVDGAPFYAIDEK